MGVGDVFYLEQSVSVAVYFAIHWSDTVTHLLPCQLELCAKQIYHPKYLWHAFYLVIQRIHYFTISLLSEHSQPQFRFCS